VDVINRTGEISRDVFEVSSDTSISVCLTFCATRNQRMSARRELKYLKIFVDIKVVYVLRLLQQW
jgi:hypothetical protein